MLARFPQLRNERDAVAQRAAVGPLAAGDGARYADELGPHLVGSKTHFGIAVAAEVDEFEVRRKLHVRERVGTFAVKAFRVFEGRADALAQQHIVGPFGLAAIGAIGQEEGTHRVILAQGVFDGFHRARTDERTADEA